MRNRDRRIRITSHLQGEDLTKQRHERARIGVGLLDQIFDTTSIIERLEHHLLNLGGDLVARALRPTFAGVTSYSFGLGVAHAQTSYSTRNSLCMWQKSAFA